MRVPWKYRLKWRYKFIKLYGLALLRSVRSRDWKSESKKADYEFFAIKLEDVRGDGMKRALGEDGSTKLYKETLSKFMALRRMVRTED